MGINIVQNLKMNRKLTRPSSLSLAGMLMSVDGIFTVTFSVVGLLKVVPLGNGQRHIGHAAHQQELGKLTFRGPEIGSRCLVT